MYAGVDRGRRLAVKSCRSLREIITLPASMQSIAAR